MSLPALTFECYQMESGLWCKRRANGLRGACVADEAILWQHLQEAKAALTAQGGRPTPSLDLAGLVKENELLCVQVKGLADENQALHHQLDEVIEENAVLRANQRKRPGRKPRSDAAGAEEQALAAPEQQDPLDEDL